MYHIVVSRNSREVINAEVRRRNRASTVNHKQQSVADEIIEEWEEKRKQSNQ